MLRSFFYCRMSETGCFWNEMLTTGTAICTCPGRYSVPPQKWKETRSCSRGSALMPLLLLLLTTTARLPKRAISDAFTQRQSRGPASGRRAALELLVDSSTAKPQGRALHARAQSP